MPSSCATGPPSSLAPYSAMRYRRSSVIGNTCGANSVSRFRPSASLPRFDQRGDVAQLGTLVLAIGLRRSLRPRRVSSAHRRFGHGDVDWFQRPDELAAAHVAAGHAADFMAGGLRFLRRCGTQVQPASCRKDVATRPRPLPAIRRFGEPSTALRPCRPLPRHELSPPIVRLIPCPPNAGRSRLGLEPMGRLPIC